MITGSLVAQHGAVLTQTQILIQKMITLVYLQALASVISLANQGRKIMALPNEDGEIAVITTGSEHGELISLTRHATTKEAADMLAKSYPLTQAQVLQVLLKTRDSTEPRTAAWEVITQQIADQVANLT